MEPRVIPAWTQELIRYMSITEHVFECIFHLIPQTLKQENKQKIQIPKVNLFLDCWQNNSLVLNWEDYNTYLLSQRLIDPPIEVTRGRMHFFSLYFFNPGSGRLFQKQQLNPVCSFSNMQNQLYCFPSATPAPISQCPLLRGIGLRPVGLLV